ncbi:hypothetical protein CBR_g21069 [Chara braunii]|uniref:Uncharacterized protein n=1 Tax=Chara braunii TaxID=69332 RepID=A0A388L0H8_CHABU|nr:hypothetical protein CBR_g21069 [Chara braunii]|eukprot:GBG75824.1 hypothetical protein CBR_g21069 [Chara braunii]
MISRGPKGEHFVVEVDVEGRKVGAFADISSTQNFISRACMDKLRLGDQVQRLSRTIASTLANKHQMVVKDYVRDVVSTFSYGGREVRHRISFLVNDELPFDPAVHAQIAELGRNFAVIKEHFDAERAKQEKKAEKKRMMEEAKKREEEAKQQEAEEKARRERKAMKKREKVHQEAEYKAELKKDLGIQVAVMMNEMQGNLVDNWRNIVGGSHLARDTDKGKKKVVFESGDEVSAEGSGGESETSVTQEIREKAERLCLSKKRKRGPDPVFEGSPPMEKTPKRTLKQGTLKPTKLSTRMTRSKARKTVKTLGSAKRRSPVKTPLSMRRKTSTRGKSPSGILTPSSKGALARLRFMNAAMKELKDFDALELQRICKEEGIHYDKKVDAIFDIVEHRTTLAFDSTTEHELKVIRITESADDGTTSAQPDAIDE